MNKLYFFLFICALFFFSCKKKLVIPEEQPLLNTEMKNGLPENLNSINGYFFASHGVNLSNTLYQKLSFRAYASFHDPGANLLKGYSPYSCIPIFQHSGKLGNVDVGSVIPI